MEAAISGAALDPVWRATELAVVGGIAHSLSSAITSLSLRAELARMDDELPAETIEMLEEQARRFQSEARLLFALRELERGGVQVHDPGELIDTAVQLFERLPEASNVRIGREQAADVVAVEVISGPCVRALVLCLRAVAESLSPGENAAAHLRVELAEGDTVSVQVMRHGVALNADSANVTAAAGLLTESTGARLHAGDQLTVRMRTARIAGV